MPKMTEEDVQGIDVVFRAMAVFILDLEQNRSVYLSSDVSLARVFRTTVNRQAEAQSEPLSDQQRRVMEATRDRVLGIVEANQ